MAKDSELSMSNLIAKQEFASVIHDPREYQVELFERAKERNIIAVLDTGNPVKFAFYLHVFLAVAPVDEPQC